MISQFSDLKNLVENDVNQNISLYVWQYFMSDVSFSGFC